MNVNLFIAGVSEMFPAAARSLEFSPSEPTKSSATRLPNLATEIVQLVCSWLDFYTFVALRLTCKALRDKSVYTFGLAFFQELRLVITVKHLLNLVDISRHPIFGKHVRYITFVSQPLSPLKNPDLMNPATYVYCARNPELEAFLRLLAQQDMMRKLGSDVRMLVAAFENFKSLQGIQLSYIFANAEYPIFQTVGKTNYLRTQWFPKAFYPSRRSQARLIAPMGVKGLKPSNAPMEPALKDIVRKIKLQTLRLYPMEEAIVEALEKSGHHSVTIDITVMIEVRELIMGDSALQGRFAAWNSMPFDLNSPTWAKIAETRLRSLAIHDRNESNPWVEVLLANAPALERVEKIRLSRPTLLGHGLSSWNMQHFSCNALRHLILSRSHVTSWELVCFFSTAGRNLETIHLSNVLLSDLHGNWSPVLAAMHRLPRLCSVYLENLSGYSKPSCSTLGCRDPRRVMEAHGKDVSRLLERAAINLDLRCRKLAGAKFSYEDWFVVFDARA